MTPEVLPILFVLYFPVCDRLVKSVLIVYCAGALLLDPPF